MSGGTHAQIPSPVSVVNHLEIELNARARAEDTRQSFSRDSNLKPLTYLRPKSVIANTLFQARAKNRYLIS